MDSSLSAGLTLRRARVEDAGAIAALMGAVDQADGLEPWVTETDVREDLRDPDLQLDTDTWVVDDQNGLVGYAELWNAREEEAHALETQVWTSPSHLGRGIGSTLLDEIEGAAVRAARSLRRRPLLLRNFIQANGESARSMLEERGYELVRHYFHMAIELDEVGDPPPVPDGLTLRWFEPERDARIVHALINDAFRDHWNWTPISFESFWGRIGEREADEASLTPMIFEGERLVGVSYNATKIGQGWVQDLAVVESARRRGIGELLLRHTFARFRSRGWSKVGLGLDSSNPTGALRLYERVGMHVTRGFDAYEKVVAS